MSADMLTATDEALLVGKSEAAVSRARRLLTHPAGPARLLLDHTTGRTVRPDVRAELIRAKLLTPDGEVAPKGARILDRQTRTIGKIKVPVAPADRIVKFWASYGRQRGPAAPVAARQSNS